MESSQPSSGNGCFFAIDQRTFSNICALGRNAATTYLVQACGTGRDHRTTAWSANAVETYTNISRGRAKAAIGSLIDNGYVHRTGNPSRPRYELIPWRNLRGNRPHPLTPREQKAFEHISRGEPLPSNLKQAASAAVRKGWLKRIDTGVFETIADDSSKHLVWLPNSLVTGAADETPPLERVRQTGDVMTLWLLADLYQSQNLREDGGISRSVIYQEWERFAAAQYGEFTVWGFTEGDVVTACTSDVVKAHWDNDADTNKETFAPFWPRLRSLEDCGLIEWVPCLHESNDADAEIIHPLMCDDSGSPEDRLGRAAHQAGLSMLTASQHDRAFDENGASWVVPIKRHIANVQLISVARLRYRPHTKLTAAWWAETNTVCDAHIAEYEALLVRASQGPAYAVGAS